jgi:hypothetical protein
MDKGAFTSGAVCLGNANLEFITRASEFSPMFAPTEPLTVRGIAFEPGDGEGIETMLDERGFPHSGAVTHEGQGGDWTNVFLSNTTPFGVMLFMCEYRGDTRRERIAVRDAFRGGVLPVRRMAELTIGVVDLDAAMDEWRRLLSPAEPDKHGSFHVGDGPAIRLRRSPMEGVAGMWLEVESLARAREALHARDLLGPTRASGVGLDYARTGGLDVWLTEPR